MQTGSFDSVAVLGAGTMGQGLARMFASSGRDVRIYDRDVLRADQVAEELTGGVTSTLRVRSARALDEAVAGADLVIETVTEDLGIKRRLFSTVSRLNTEAVLTSNSSTYQPSDLQGDVEDPSRLLVAHFFNPADVVPLVEIVKGPLTDDRQAQRVADTLRGMGKDVVVLQKEVPGCVANRLQAALLREALHLLHEGVLDVNDLDTVVTRGVGPRWAALGPFRTVDLGGLDVFAALCTRLFPGLSSQAEPELLHQMVDDGRLGAKTGRGFYSYDEQAIADHRRATELAFTGRPASAVTE